MLTKANLLWTSVLISMLALVHSCVKYPENVGPEYHPATKDFKVKDDFVLVNANGLEEEAPDFSKTNTYGFKADFNEKVDWVIRIKSLSSNSQKVLRGTGNALGLTTAKWAGGHTGSNTTFFKKNDVCVAELSILGSMETYRDTFKIGGVLNFNRPDVIVIGKSDMETNLTFPAGFAIGQNIEKSVGRRVADSKLSVEGQSYFELSGTPATTACDQAQYFCGSVQMRYNVTSYKDTDDNFIKSGTNFTTLWEDPNDVWVNVYVYNYDTKENQNSIFSLQFHEADASNNAQKPITYIKAINPCAYELAYTAVDSGRSRIVPKNFHDPNTDDSWEASWKVSDLKPGWNLLSKKYSELSRSQSITNGGNGNKLQEPNRVHRVQAALISSPKATHCKMAFEYVTYTKGKPFNPDDY